VYDLWSRIKMNFANKFVIEEARKIINKPSCYDRDCFYSICEHCPIKNEMQDIQKLSREITQQKLKEKE
jgi:hypothetical protein